MRSDVPRKSSDLLPKPNGFKALLNLRWPRQVSTASSDSPTTLGSAHDETPSSVSTQRTSPGRDLWRAATSTSLNDLLVKVPPGSAPPDYASTPSHPPRTQRAREPRACTRSVDQNAPANSKLGVHTGMGKVDAISPSEPFPLRPRHRRPSDAHRALEPVPVHPLSKALAASPGTFDWDDLQPAIRVSGSSPIDAQVDRWPTDSSAAGLPHVSPHGGAPLTHQPNTVVSPSKEKRVPPDKQGIPDKYTTPFARSVQPTYGATRPTRAAFTRHTTQDAQELSTSSPHPPSSRSPSKNHNHDHVHSQSTERVKRKHSRRGLQPSTSHSLTTTPVEPRYDRPVSNVPLDPLPAPLLQQQDRSITSARASKRSQSVDRTRSTPTPAPHQPQGKTSCSWARPWSRQPTEHNSSSPRSGSRRLSEDVQSSRTKELHGGLSRRFGSLRLGRGRDDGNTPGARTKNFKGPPVSGSSGAARAHARAPSSSRQGRKSGALPSISGADAPSSAPAGRTSSASTRTNGTKQGPVMDSGRPTTRSTTPSTRSVDLTMSMAGSAHDSSASTLAQPDASHSRRPHCTPRDSSTEHSAKELLQKANTMGSVDSIGLGLNLEPERSTSQPREVQHSAVTVRRIEVSPSHFRRVRILGQGDVGRVYLVQDKHTNTLYAMKVLSKKDLFSRDKVRRALLEQRILLRAHHPFIVRLYHTFQSSEFLYLCMDYANGGELFGVLQARETPTLPESDARFYAAEVVLALGFLHSLGVIYRDLKPENLLLKRNGHLALADFDLSAICATDDPEQRAAYRTNSLVGTEVYLAPEIIRGHGHGSAVDWWTLGILIYEMICAQTPFTGSTQDETFDLILHAEVEWPSNLAGEGLGFRGQNIVRQLLTKDERQRLGSSTNADQVSTFGGVEQVQAHPWFARTPWSSLHLLDAPLCADVQPLEEDLDLAGTQPVGERPRVPDRASNPSDPFDGFDSVTLLHDD